MNIFAVKIKNEMSVHTFDIYLYLTYSTYETAAI